MKDIEIIDIDYSAKDTAYKKEDDVEVGKISGPWIVPEEGPFYGDSVRVIGNSGLDLIPGVDFSPVEPVTNLTEATGKDVHLYIELKDHIISSGGNVKLIYQRVGKPIISVKTLLQMLEDMIITGKPIDWETQVTGKPKTVPSAWHSHDIQNPNELIGFGGLVELFSRLTWEHTQSGARMKELIDQLQAAVYGRLGYIQRLKWGVIFTHIRNYKNPHDVQPVHVDLGNVANYFTATPQQDADGDRPDLYSTPVGLVRQLEEAEPESEEFISQNELPFGYYGSGTYLPPPITGSFEGLGSDQENSAFCLEGNGWLVGLIRAYDGRVKNLYYIYNMDFKDRDYNRSPWLNTYVKYTHPVPTAAGKQVNFVVCGSNDSVLMVGNWQNSLSSGGIEDPDGWWLTASNSTFDPNSHNLKPVNMRDIMAACPGTIIPGHLIISHVGDWVYLWVGQDTFAGDSLGPGADYAVTGANYQQRMFRVRYSDLLDANKPTINFLPVNVTFDNLDRLHRQNEVAFFPERIQRVPGTTTHITEAVVKYTVPVHDMYLNRRVTIFVVPNPNNPRLARVKVLFEPYQFYTEPTGGARGFWISVMAGYDWDVESNTLTLDSHWVKPTWNTITSQPVDSDQNFKDFIHAEYWGAHSNRFSNVGVSLVPGYGFVSIGSLQAGAPPYQVASTRINRSDDPKQDYSDFAKAINYNPSPGQLNTWFSPFRMRSPFGVAGFPRHYSQLYVTVDGPRQAPIELFVAENEDQTQQMFYRVSEGGADDGYVSRPSLQSAYINKDIRGRKTNSSFGVVKGLGYNIGYLNRPRRRNTESRSTALLSWVRRQVHTNPGSPYDIMPRTDYNGNIVKTPQEVDGSVLVNLDVDYSLDTVAKVLSCKANPAKQLRIPRAIWADMVYSAMGAHVNELIDIGVNFYFDTTPGGNGDQTYSMWSATYHVKSSPGRTRMFIGVFNWEVDYVGADGIRVARLTNMAYPFNAAAHGMPQNQLAPGAADNTAAVDMHAIGPDGSWLGIWYDTGLSVKGLHMQVLDIDAEGPRNKEQVYMPGLQLSTPGNAANPRIVYRVRNGVMVEATCLWVGAQAFGSEYNNVVFANQDYGWMFGVSPKVSGAAMDLMQPWPGTYSDQPIPPGDFYVMNGATYVEGNWSIFVNADVLVTFNGYSMNAKMTNWDLRDLSDVYRNSTFYIYCVAKGSVAEYEVTKILRNHNSNAVLVAIVKTDDFGIVTIDRRQSFSISGFQLTRDRDMGVPVSSGALTEQGTYQFLKRSELY